ncbi:MAG: translation initiation factor IF-2 [Candidatus Thermoplasmatota archaeon]|nr:translation initiation factor IF-2 [Candidatus Thermoplasmatota archaeon]
MTIRIRQPIVSVLGHVDHGKTTFLDRIRGTAVVDREAGRITQHIGATEVPTEAILRLCGCLMQGKSLTIPGLLFIDTPGHESFTTLRARGGSLADLAILIVDIMEGIKPQTLESINILKQYKTPFIIGLNKLDRINGWSVMEDETFAVNLQRQDDLLKQELDNRIYDLMGELSKHGFNADIYTRVNDFRKTIAMVPMSAVKGMGIPDALMLLIGLAQRFLEEDLHTEDGPGEGTILEVKEEKGLGTTLDSIIFSGMIQKDDRIVVGTRGEPAILRVKSLLKPKPLDEIRDPREKFYNIHEAHAAAGVKILAKNAEGVIAGAPIRVVSGDMTEEMAIKQVRALTEVSFETTPDGLYIKADAIGSLEALNHLLTGKDVKIWKAEVGDISERDIKDVGSFEDPLRRIILAFNVRTLPGVDELAEESDVRIIRNNVIYKIIEDHEEWYRKRKQELDDERRMEYAHPAKFLVMRDHTFRVSKPAVVGVRILAGRIRASQSVMREDGKVLGKIVSMQSEKRTLKEAKMGEEMAMAISGPMVGRHFNEEEVLYIDIPEHKVPELLRGELSVEEREVLDHIIQVKRREKPTWGMG